MNVALRGLTVLVGGTASRSPLATQRAGHPGVRGAGRHQDRPQLQPERRRRALHLLRPAAQRRRLHSEAPLRRHAAGDAQRLRPVEPAVGLRAAVGRGRRRRPARLHRRRLRRPERRVRPRDLPHPVRPAGLHDGQRLLPEAQPERRDQPAAGRRHRLGRRDLARPRHGLGRLPELRITLIEANDASDNLFTAVKEAATLGAKFVSMSWGGAEGGTEATYDSTYFKSTGVVYTASTGDDAYSGRRHLPGHVARRRRGRRHVADDRVERARLDREGLEDQHHRGHRLGLLERRGQAVVAEHHLVLDVQQARRRPTSRPSPTRRPASRSTRPTAAAAGPSTAARAPRRRSSPRSTRWPARPSSTTKPGVAARTRTPANLNDVTSGNNGTCSPTLLCTAAAGWDGPTGLGTPNGTAAFGGSGGGGGGNTVTVTNPGSKTGTVGTATTLQISATDSGGAALTYSATGLPTGLSINASSGLISGTPSAAGTFSRDGHGEGHDQRLGQRVVHLDDLDVRRRRSCSGPEARQPGLRVGCDRLDADAAA